MKASAVSLLLLGAALAACDRESQQLPFGADGAGVVREVPSAGAVLSTPAGASVQFPQGSMGASVEVRLTPVSSPAAARVSGVGVSAGFQLEPADLRLAKPAGVELRFNPAADRSRAWLASVVNVTSTGVRELGDTRVDLSTGVASSRISQLGTLAVVIPDPKAVVYLRRGAVRASSPASSSALASTGTDSVVIRCGDSSNRCEGITVTASENLTSRVTNAALVYPAIDGVLRITGSSVSGELVMASAFRAQLDSTAENVTINGRIESTTSSTVSESSSQLSFSAMRHSISGSAASGSNSEVEVTTLTISKASTPTVSITRSFRIANSSGGLEPASVTVTFPVKLHQ